MSAPVTVTAKRYPHVFICRGCRHFGWSDRSDAVTCSPACRVKWHRSDDRAQTLEMLKAPFFEGVTVALMARIEALRELRPDLADRLWAGEKIDYRIDVWDALIERAKQVLEAGK